MPLSLHWAPAPSCEHFFLKEHKGHPHLRIKALPWLQAQCLCPLPALSQSTPSSPVGRGQVEPWHQSQPERQRPPAAARARGCSRAPAPPGRRGSRCVRGSITAREWALCPPCAHTGSGTAPYGAPPSRICTSHMGNGIANYACK